MFSINGKNLIINYVNKAEYFEKSIYVNDLITIKLKKIMLYSII